MYVTQCYVNPWLYKASAFKYAVHSMRTSVFPRASTVRILLHFFGL